MMETYITVIFFTLFVIWKVWHKKHTLVQTINNVINDSNMVLLFYAVPVGTFLIVSNETYWTSKRLSFTLRNNRNNVIY